LAYNSAWLLPIVLTFNGTLVYTTGFVAFTTITDTVILKLLRITQQQLFGDTAKQFINTLRLVLGWH